MAECFGVYSPAGGKDRINPNIASARIPKRQVVPPNRFGFQPGEQRVERLKREDLTNRSGCSAAHFIGTLCLVTGHQFLAHSVYFFERFLVKNISGNSQVAGSSGY